MTGIYSHWNYRVLHENGVYWIGEVYWKDGEPAAYSDPISPQGETLKELDDDVRRMYGALGKPTIGAW